MACLMAGAVYAQAQRPARGRVKREVVHPKVGEELKDFTLKDVNGKPVKLSDFRGKKIFALELGACT